MRNGGRPEGRLPYWIKSVVKKIRLDGRARHSERLVERLRPKTDLFEAEQTQHGKFLTFNYSRERQRYYNRILKQVNEIENIKAISVSLQKAVEDKLFGTKDFYHDAMKFKTYFVGRLQLVKSDYYIWDSLENEQHLHSHLLPTDSHVQ